MKKKALWISVACIALIIGGSALYLNSDVYAYDISHFSENTKINGVDCSGMDVDQAEQTLTKAWNDRTYEVIRDGEVIGQLKEMNLSYGIKRQLQELIHPNMFEPIKTHLTKEKRDLTVRMDPLITEKFQEQIDDLPFLHEGYQVKTANAYVDMDTHEFNIVAEVQGDNVDPDRFTAAVKNDLADGIFRREYDPADYYELPTVRADDPALLEEQKFAKNHYSQKITYQTYRGGYTIEPKYLAQMMPASDQGSTMLDEKAVKEFVKKTLTKKLNTADRAHKFKTAGGKTIKVEGGDYGYLIDQEKEETSLLQALKTGNDIEREPYYTKKATAKGNETSDIGDSYVEVDLSAQTAYLFVKGKKQLSTAVVTGMGGRHDTPTGVYSIQAKQTHATLRGFNDDGSKYASPVTYWMPFNGGVGLHDATWRGSFGGGIYTYNGSHGCVNMPYGAAAEVFSQVKEGWPVIVHY